MTTYVWAISQYEIWKYALLSKEFHYFSTIIKIMLFSILAEFNNWWVIHVRVYIIYIIMYIVWNANCACMRLHMCIILCLSLLNSRPGIKKLKDIRFSACSYLLPWDAVIGNMHVWSQWIRMTHTARLLQPSSSLPSPQSSAPSQWYAAAMHRSFVHMKYLGGEQSILVHAHEIPWRWAIYIGTCTWNTLEVSNLYWYMPKQKASKHHSKQTSLNNAELNN